MIKEKKRYKKLKKLLLIALLIILALFLLSLREIPADVTYGASFSKFHSDELRLDWRETYRAILDDLKVRHLRFSAHWHMVEPEEGKYNFSEIDYQMDEAKKRGADVILAVGRRLPGWPECHEPEWVKKLPEEQKKKRVLTLISTLVDRYRNYSNLKYWQVENEYFLTLYGKGPCGESFGEDFLKSEVALVRALDPSRKIILTDGGEFGAWYKAYKNADIFGSSLYLYIWSHFKFIGPTRYPITPGFFRIKQNIINLIFGKKPIILIELSAEPYLIHPIIETPVEVTNKRMGLDKFREMVSVARQGGFDTQYFWGAEWWYYEKVNGRSQIWSEAKKIFQD